MKTIAVFLILCIANSSTWWTDEEEAELKRYRLECSKEIEITVEAMKKVLMEESNDDKDKLECYVECLFNKERIMDKDGNIDEKVFRGKMPKYVPKTEVDFIVEQCIDIEAETRCKKAAEFAKCVIKSMAIQELSS